MPWLGSESLAHTLVLVVQVFCWLVDRLGGGWTLGWVSAYRWCHPNGRGGGGGSVDNNVLGTVKPFFSFGCFWALPQ